MRIKSLFVVTLALVSSLTGCKKTEVTAYETPKEKATVNAPFLQQQMQSGAAGGAIPPDAMASGTLPPGHPEIGGTATASTPGMPPASGMPMAAQGLPPGSTLSGGNPEWTIPANWSPGPASSIRKASYMIKEGDATADISVTAFPGGVGGNLANLNRWRGQVGLPPAQESDMASQMIPLQVGNISGTVVDLTGTQSRMIVVTLPYDGNSWFLKISGNAALLEKEKASFMDFVQSVRF